MFEFIVAGFVTAFVLRHAGDRLHDIKRYENFG